MKTVGLRILFIFGMAIGVVMAPFIFLWAFFKGARPIHFDGAVCKAQLTAIDPVAGRRLEGPCLARLSGGLGKENATGKDVLGFSVRCQQDFSDDLAVGDQDLVFGTFRSFLSLPGTIGDVKVADYLANEYSSVTPWRVADFGSVTLRARPPRTEPRDGENRLARLDADIAAGTAAFTIEGRRGNDWTALATLTLVQRLPVNGNALRISMFNTGRKYVPTGARNGIRAIVYPVSQVARRLRSG
ncbi:MAG: hypothetical protein F9K40_22865 [Kofleriaceae bacterium]|nr:MAG: hypothetical protein F9K40_22865 [Kofleriaceae bacterium]MBZ0236014.1 hypothetical protein [Kofleriaceae bacterium]